MKNEISNLIYILKRHIFFDAGNNFARVKIIQF